MMATEKECTFTFVAASSLDLLKEKQFKEAFRKKHTIWWWWR